MICTILEDFVVPNPDTLVYAICKADENPAKSVIDANELVIVPVYVSRLTNHLSTAYVMF